MLCYNIYYIISYIISCIIYHITYHISYHIPYHISYISYHIVYHIIFIGNKIVAQIKSRLDSKCSNNQAEQIAIINALEAVATLNIPENSPRTAMVYTDSKITLDSLQNPRNHAYLIEEIRKRVATLHDSILQIEFSWIKAHAGILGNETADKLAKEAARTRLIDITFSRIPISSVYHDIQTDSIKR